MDIKININLDQFNAEQIIDLYDRGLLTLQEIKTSNRHISMFSDDLRKWIKAQEKLIKNEGNEEKTAA